MLTQRRPTEFPDNGSLAANLAADGFVYLGPDAMQQRLGTSALSGWPRFASTWSTLEKDAYMRDGGEYRRRRHAVFRSFDGGIQRQPDRPHYQAKAFNHLNGGIDRQFASVTSDVASDPLTLKILTAFLPAFEGCRGDVSAPAWAIEMHQFRIEVTGQDYGLPTPEGMHRDGVDWVVMMLVSRENVAGGLTTIVDDTGSAVAQLQMRQPMETIVVDDHRLQHGVSPITAVDPALVGFRDILVATYSVL